MPKQAIQENTLVIVATLKSRYCCDRFGLFRGAFLCFIFCLFIVLVSCAKNLQGPKLFTFDSEEIEIKTFIHKFRCSVLYVIFYLFIVLESAKH